MKLIVMIEMTGAWRSDSSKQLHGRAESRSLTPDHRITDPEIPTNIVFIEQRH